MGLEQAIFWGFLSGVPLIAGAVITRFFTFSKKILGITMAFGSGVLISVFVISLLKEAYGLGGLVPVSIGFFIGVLLFVIANDRINKRGGKYRKKGYASEAGNDKATGGSLALGSLMDNIPESAALGVALLIGSPAGIGLLAGIITSNFPEAAAGAQSMKIRGRSDKFILGVWTMIAGINILAASFGFLVLAQLGSGTIAFTLSLAAGGILAMLAETMMPEAYQLGGYHVSIATAAGFWIATVI